MYSAFEKSSSVALCAGEVGEGRGSAGLGTLPPDDAANAAVEIATIAKAASAADFVTGVPIEIGLSI